MSLPHRLSGRAGAIAHGAALCRERRALGWSTQRLAMALGVEASLLHRAEAGDAPLMASMLIRAARAMGRQPSRLMPTPGEFATATLIADLDAAASLHDL